MAERLRVTEALRELMAEVVERLDSQEEDTFLDVDDAVQVDGAWGGRVAPDQFRFIYRPERATRWEFTLGERQVRDVADGHLEVVSAVREPMGARAASPEQGVALLMWGDGPSDALSVRDPEALRAALGAL